MARLSQTDPSTSTSPARRNLSSDEKHIYLPSSTALQYTLDLTINYHLQLATLSLFRIYLIQLGFGSFAAKLYGLEKAESSPRIHTSHIAHQSTQNHEDGLIDHFSLFLPLLFILLVFVLIQLETQLRPMQHSPTVLQPTKQIEPHHFRRNHTLPIRTSKWAKSAPKYPLRCTSIPTTGTRIPARK